MNHFGLRFLYNNTGATNIFLHLTLIMSKEMLFFHGKPLHHVMTIKKKYNQLALDYSHLLDMNTVNCILYKSGKLLEVPSCSFQS